MARSNGLDHPDPSIQCRFHSSTTAGMIIQLSHCVLEVLPWFHNETVLYLGGFLVCRCHQRLLRKLLSCGSTLRSLTFIGGLQQ